MNKRINIVFPAKPSKHGGVGSFQIRLSKNFKKKGVSYTFKSPRKGFTNVCLVMGGTRRILWLLILKAKGIKIVHRLDGLNWQHKVEYPGFKNYIKAQLRLLIVAFIRRFLADGVIYQSKFVLDFWNSYDLLNTNHAIIHNGVEMQTKNTIAKLKEKGIKRVLCVEGEINGSSSYEILKSFHKHKLDVVGLFSKEASSDIKNVNFHGKVSRNKVKDFYKGRVIFLNLEVNPACPNSVIEALSFGIPVVGFDSGSLAELVGNAGILSNYQGKHWSLETPSLESLHDSIDVIFDNYNMYSEKAFDISKAYNIDITSDRYYEFISRIVNTSNTN
jgi:glycosyltransferase involved in cell wall biosynthesis